MKKFNVAVVGATGNVGRELLNILTERDFPVGEVYALASKRSAGKKVNLDDDTLLEVQDLETFDFSKVQIALFSPGASVSKVHAPRAAEAGCVVIDNTSQFRMDKDVPLVVPEVNPEAIAEYKKKGIIANPNCSTIQMVVALKPLEDLSPIKRVVVSTYQSVSGAGKNAMDELFAQTKAKFINEQIEPTNFTKQIAFNVIPHIDVFMDDGSTKEEWKMQVETKKIMHDDIEVHANCVRVPVFVGHAEMVNVEFEDPIDLEEIRKAFEEAEGITVIDRREDGGYITPKESVQENEVFISRLREDKTVEHGISMWVVADNVRKGAALNAVQIAEILAKDYL